MRKLLITSIAMLMSIALAGCGNGGGPAAAVNLAEVLDRTVKTLENFATYLKRYDYKEVDAAMFEQFAKTIERDLNNNPKFHPTAIATRINKDASVVGYGDINANGEIEAQEPKLFTIELDPDNNRIIITSAYGSSTGRVMPRGSGIFAGVFFGSLVDRQRGAGINRGHFNTRNVANAPLSKPVATRTARASSTARHSRARSRARSGGIRAGK